MKFDGTCSQAKLVNEIRHARKQGKNTNGRGLCTGNHKQRMRRLRRHLSGEKRRCRAEEGTRGGDGRPGKREGRRDLSAERAEEASQSALHIAGSPI